MSSLPKYLSNYLFRIADKSFEMELDRYDSLIGASERLLTCDSILSVATTALLPTLLNLVSRHYGIILFFFFLSLILIFISFSLSAICQFRFKYYELPSPGKLSALLQGEAKSYKSVSTCAVHYCSSIEPIFQSLKKRNDRLSLLSRLSLSFLLASLGITIFQIIICIVFYIES